MPLLIKLCTAIHTLHVHTPSLILSLPLSLALILPFSVSPDSLSLSHSHTHTHTLTHTHTTGSGDIVSGNLKLILGLIWTLILHYQISMGFGIDDDGGRRDGLSAKQALLEWLRVSCY